MSVRFADKRKSPRVEINATAKIIAMSGLRVKETVDCRIVNISEGGALIIADRPITHSEFYLEVDRERGVLYLCSVVRRESTSKVGVRFI